MELEFFNIKAHDEETMYFITNNICDYFIINTVHAQMTLTLKNIRWQAHKMKYKPQKAARRVYAAVFS